jgi:hypothetical protein
MSKVIKKLDLRRETVRDLRVKAGLRTGPFALPPGAWAGFEDPIDIKAAGGLKTSGSGSRSMGQSESSGLKVNF